MRAPRSGTDSQVVVVNLDPANDAPPYTPDVDISDLVDLSNVMQVCMPCDRSRATCV